MNDWELNHDIIIVFKREKEIKEKKERMSFRMKKDGRKKGYLEQRQHIYFNDRQYKRLKRPNRPQIH